MISLQDDFISSQVAEMSTKENKRLQHFQVQSHAVHVREILLRA